MSTVIAKKTLCVPQEASMKHMMFHRDRSGYQPETDLFV